MTLVVPNVGTYDNLNKYLNDTLTLKLYSNNRTPAVGDVASSYTEVSGGGYASSNLVFANFTVTTANPSVAIYNAYVEYTFTSTTASPSVIYGYYVVNSGGTLKWAERFDEDDVPFTPVNGSLVQIKPRLTAQNLT